MVRGEKREEGSVRVRMVRVEGRARERGKREGFEGFEDRSVWRKIGKKGDEERVCFECERKGKGRGRTGKEEETDRSVV